MNQLFSFVPYANANPTNQNAMLPKHASKMFFIKILLEFFARTLPFSTSANPACMRKIIAIETVTQTAFVASFTV